MKKGLLVLSTLIITMFATTMVAFAGSETLKLGTDGIWWYYNNDSLDTSKEGMVEYDGGLFVVIGGRVRTDFMGMCHVEFPNADVDKWYFFAQGQVQKERTGFAEYDGAWFYLNQGELDQGANGFYEYDGGLFLVAAGQIKAEYSGLYQNTEGAMADNQWYFIANGQVQKQYTGYTVYDGVRFYLENGRLVDENIGNKEEEHSHSYTAKVTKEATCTQEGVNTCVCSCGKSYTEKIDMLPHTYEWDTKGDTRTQVCTCGAKGITEYCYNGAWGYFDDVKAATLWGYVNECRNEGTTYTVQEQGVTIGIANVDALIEDEALMDKARIRATETAKEFSHGENENECLAWGQGSPEEAMDSWLWSHGHMYAITNPDYVYGGIACFYYDSDNSGTNLTPIWVLEMDYLLDEDTGEIHTHSYWEGEEEGTLLCHKCGYILTMKSWN